MDASIWVSLVTAGVAITTLLLNRHWHNQDLKKEKDSEVLKKVSIIESALNKHIEVDDERYIVQRREVILRFNDELRHGTKHTKEHFDQVLLSITEYNNYCSTHKDFPNNITVAATANIQRVYEKCMQDNSFL